MWRLILRQSVLHERSLESRILEVLREGQLLLLGLKLGGCHLVGLALRSHLKGVALSSHLVGVALRVSNLVGVALRVSNLVGVALTLGHLLRHWEGRVLRSY